MKSAKLSSVYIEHPLDEFQGTPLGMELLPGAKKIGFTDASDQMQIELFVAGIMPSEMSVDHDSSRKDVQA